MNNFFEIITKSPFFNFLVGIAGIGSCIIGFFAIKSILKKIKKSKQITEIDEQNIKGSFNKQAGQDYISSENNKSIDISKKESKIKIKKQSIDGNNNIQAGGDIIE